MKRGLVVVFFFVCCVSLGVGWLLWARLDFSAPKLVVSPQKTALGARNPLDLTLTDAGAGLRSVEVSLTQGGRTLVPFKTEWPVAGLRQGTGVMSQRLQVTLEPRRLGLAQGPAELLISVRDASFLGNETTLRQPVTIDWRPPRLQLLSGTVNINHGGVGYIIYKLEEPATHGVKVGDRFFPGYPLEELGQGVACCYFAWPVEMTEPPYNMVVVARDAAGNEGKAGFYFHLRDKTFRADSVELSEQFLTNVVADLLPAGVPQKSLVADFLAVNRGLRSTNHQRIAEVCATSNPKRLWKGPFRRMNNAAPMAAFADRRTYLYGGQEIDQQTHLGVDLASLAGAPAEAANSGTVAFADELGIYGNCVIIDHGQGVFSLYGHLSSLNVSAGQQVQIGQIIGRTGSTGLAGGDHLHFSVLVSGVFVNPVEWWDSHWVQDNVDLKYQQAKEALAPPPPLPGPGAQAPATTGVIY